MVYQAIAEYWVSANEEEYDVNVNIGIPGRNSPEKFNFNRANHYTTRTASVRIHTQCSFAFICVHLHSCQIGVRGNQKQAHRHTVAPATEL